MIYACQTRCCYFLFRGGTHETACPDCGKKRIRPANHTERAEYFRRRMITGGQGASPAKLASAGSR